MAVHPVSSDITGSDRAIRILTKPGIWLFVQLDVLIVLVHLFRCNHKAITGFVVFNLSILSQRAVYLLSLQFESTYNMHCKATQELAKSGSRIALFVEKLTPDLLQRCLVPACR